MARERKISPIFEVIRKLDKEEKRAFKLYASTYERKGNAAVKLFDIISAYCTRLADTAEPLETAIAPQLKKEGLNTQYNNIKSRLKTLLWDFLRDRKEGEDPMQRVRQKISLANVMIARGHVTIGRAMLSEAKKIAIDHESYDHWLMCLTMEEKVLTDLTDPKEEELTALHTEAKEALIMQDEWTDAKYDQTRVFLARIRWKSRPPDITTEALKEKISKTRSVKTKNQYYMALCQISRNLDPIEVTKTYCLEHIQMLEDHLKPVQESICRYFTAYAALMLIYNATKDAKGFKAAVKRKESKFHLYKDHLDINESTSIRIIMAHHLITYCLLIDDRQAMKAEAPVFEKIFIDLSDQISPIGIATFRLELRDAYFFAGLYADAERWAMSEMCHEHTRPSETLSGHLIELICACELGYNIEVLRTKIRKVRYYMTVTVTDSLIVTFMEDFMRLILLLHSARHVDEQLDAVNELKACYDANRHHSELGIRSIMISSRLSRWFELRLN